jgi:hypothetical protein
VTSQKPPIHEPLGDISGLNHKMGLPSLENSLGSESASQTQECLILWLLMRGPHIPGLPIGRDGLCPAEPAQPCSLEQLLGDHSEPSAWRWLNK